MNFTIKTIGCKVNTYESEKIRDELIKLGFNYIDVEEKDKYKELDFYIVNTCSVTKIADKKSRQMLHLAKKYNPNVKVIAIGCMVDSFSVGADTIRKTVGADIIRPTECDNYVNTNHEPTLTGVDYLITNKNKNKLKNLLLSLVGADIIRPTENVPPHRIRAFIKIQDGCNQYCTYCIIPYLRGNIKSRNDEDIIEEIEAKTKNGVKEIVLTGIHLSSFGLDRVNKTYESEGAIDIARESLLNIMNKVALIDGVERIRLGSLEPRIISEKFLKELVNTDTRLMKDDIKFCSSEKYVQGKNIGFSNKLESKFCANFCLSLQSGSDKTLKRMNRHYTTYDFENACNLIRKYMPYATITTDIIVGFPGETEEDFENSLSFIKKMRFYNPNIFPYSRRQGTKADKMPDQLTNEVKHSRSIRTINECEKITKDIEKEYLEKYSDRAKDVLVEDKLLRNGELVGVGYTKEYVRREVIFLKKLSIL